MIATEQRPCILVVDDSRHDQEIYGRMLNYNGYDVIFASTGAQAVNRADTHVVDAVLLDLGLPDGNGLDVLRLLRERPGYAATPVIVLSGYPRSQKGDDAACAGCIQYIEKPAKPVHVLHAVEELIGRAPLAGIGRPPVALDPD